MPVPVNHVGMSDIQTEYGGSSEISLTEYYRGDQYVPINQLKSIHTNKEIPLVSGGRTQEISIGMFRGTAKQFEWVFEIRQDRYTTFNLYNELVAVGWGEDVPIKVTINVFNGVYVVSQNTSTPTIDASMSFPQGSELYLLNSGNIYGRGGKGGTGGRYPDTNGGTGENGGTAFHTSIRTKILNTGTIAGGGGGGGGSAGVIRMDTEDMSVRSNLLPYYGIGGRGGQPFGQNGDRSMSPSSLGDISVMSSEKNWTNSPSGPFESTQYVFQALSNVDGIYSGQEITPSAPDLSYEATLLDRGYFGKNTNFTDTSRFMSSFTGKTAPGNGGRIGSMGDSGTNLINDFYTGRVNAGTIRYFYYWQTQPGTGGESGFAIIGGQFIEWVFNKTGKLLGKTDQLILADKNLSNISTVTQLLAGNFHYAAQITSGGGASGGLQFAPPWKRDYLNGYAFSYSPETNLTSKSTNSIGSSRTINPNRDPIGSPLRVIKYFCLLTLDSAQSIYIEGTVDDRISQITLNGAPQSVNAPLNKDTVTSTGTFVAPAGVSVLEVTVRDDNNNSGSPSGNLHKVHMTVRAAPYAAEIIGPDRWFIGEINAL